MRAQEPVVRSQNYATTTPIRTVIYLPRNYENIVFSVNVSLQGTIVTLGEPIISLPDVESIETMRIEESFTYDTTWTPRLLPRATNRTIGTNQFNLLSNASTDHDITLDVIPGENQYLVGVLLVSITPLYADRQNMSGFYIGPVRPVE